MGTVRYDDREFTSTYFALRVGLVVSVVVVLMAPTAAWLVGGGLPPSISDSWYTDARTVFVLGLGAGSGLLIVVRGDTLSEQTLLNVAGWFGLVVAGAACWPKDEDGVPLESYDPLAADLGVYAVGALLATATLVWLVGTFVLPEELVGTGWHTGVLVTRFLQATYPVLLAVGWLVFLRDPRGVVERIHEPFATTMFLLLGGVALLHTSWGLALLEHIGDTPVDGTVSELKRCPAKHPEHTADRYDWIYAGVALGMVVVVLAAVVLMRSQAPPGWVLGVETALLVLFGVFWGVQTREAWTERAAPVPDHEPAPRRNE